MHSETTFFQSVVVACLTTIMIKQATATGFDVSESLCLRYDICTVVNCTVALVTVTVAQEVEQAMC